MKKHLHAGIKISPLACIVSTKRGSHVAWFGFWGQSCLTQCVMDYCVVLCKDALQQKGDPSPAPQAQEEKHED